MALIFNINIQLGLNRKLESNNLFKNSDLEDRLTKSFILDYLLLFQPKTSILHCLIRKNISLITNQFANYICQSANYFQRILNMNTIYTI